MTAFQLKKWRKNLGLTQAEAAKKLGYSLRHYIRLENGHAKIRLIVDLAVK